MKKILNLFGSFKLSDGGPTTLLNNFFLIERKFNSKNYIVTNDHDKKSSKNIFLYYSFFKKFHFSFNLVKLLNNKINSFDHIVVHGTRNFYLIAIYFIAKRYNKKFNLFLHGSLHALENKTNFLKKFYFYFVDKNILKSKFCKILVTSDKEKNLVKKLLKLKNLNKNKLGKVELGIYETKKRNILNTNKKYFLYLGRFHKIKNLDFLCKEFENFLLENRDYELLLVGPESTYKYFLKKKYKHVKNIKFKNFAKKTKKTTTIYNSQAIIVSSKSENFNYSIVEALSLKVPVLLNKNLDLSFLIKKNNCGVLFDMKNNSLKEKLVFLSKISKQNYLFMRREAYKLFLKKFNLKKNYSNYLKLLN